MADEAGSNEKPEVAPEPEEALRRSLYRHPLAAIGGALNLLSNDMSTALAVALAVRLYNYTFSGIVGIYGFNTEGETLSGIYQKIKEMRKKT